MVKFFKYMIVIYNAHIYNYVYALILIFTGKLDSNNLNFGWLDFLIIYYNQYFTLKLLVVVPISAHYVLVFYGIFFMSIVFSTNESCI